MPKIFIDYRPAEVVSKKETYVEYYVLNPYTGALVRKRIRCNRVHSKSENVPSRLKRAFFLPKKFIILLKLWSNLINYD